MNEPLPPLPDLSKQLLRDAQRTAPEPSVEQADRLLGRLKASVATSAAAAGGASAAVAKGAGVVKLVSVALLAGGLGLGGGVWLGRTQWAPPPQIIEREKVVEVRVPVPVPAPETAAPQPAPAPVPTPVAKPRAAEPKAGVDELLARERELIDTARSALLRSNADGALTALQQHAAQFPAGRLIEERESLWVQVLVARGELEAARARARDFHAKFPRSLLGPTVDAAVAPPP